VNNLLFARPPSLSAARLMRRLALGVFPGTTISSWEFNDLARSLSLTRLINIPSDMVFGIPHHGDSFAR
jgi:hypothetical protein